MPVQDGHGGGPGTLDPPYMQYPATINLGNLPVSVAFNFSFPISNQGDKLLKITSFATGGVGILTQSAPLAPIDIIGSPLHSPTTFNFTLTPNTLGAQVATITITSNNNGVAGTINTITINYTGVGVGGGVVQLNPVTSGEQVGVFGNGRLNVQDKKGAFFASNPGSVSYTITAVTSDNPNFLVVDPTLLPITIAPSTSNLTPLGVAFLPVDQTTQTGHITITTNLGPPQNSIVVPVSGTGVLVVPFKPLLNTQRAVMFSEDAHNLVFSGTKATGAIVPVPSFTFNGTFWNRPGEEKTLERLQIIWENVNSVELDLIISLSSIRNGTFDAQQITVPLFVPSAPGNGALFSTFCDCNITGEMITVMVAVKQPLDHFDHPLPLPDQMSLVGFIPHFADRGEIVKS